MIPSKNHPRTQKTGYKLGHGKRTVELKIATWNITSLFRTGSCQNLVDILNTYEIKIAALQKIRWTGTGQLKVGEYVIFYSGLENRHFFGTGFAIHKSLEPYVREFNPVSERILVLRVDTTPINMVLICVHASTEVSTNNDKDAFYEDLDRIYDKTPGNVIKIILGDLNAMCGKESQFQPTIGKESMHNISNDNGLRIISFASSKNMVISSTTFPHKKIHKGIWRSPDGKTINQIDHVLIQRRFRSCIVDVRRYGGADCDTDHFLLISKFKIKLQDHNSVEKKRNQFSVNLEALKNIETQSKYAAKISYQFRNIQEQDIDSEWNQAINTIKEVAEQTTGKTGSKKNKEKWFNEVCRKAIEAQRLARENYNILGDQLSREKYEKERRTCKRLLQREKRSFVNEILQNAEKDRSQGRELLDDTVRATEALEHAAERLGLHINADKTK
ncbi:hypothetical protein AGLY_017324 [Aphis glycines]|uniref:Endonuclease/exonuclease/phosphatase domain-containing protein n=1 Tax=Aphis glycines TaxID=307491 RepID=A0A6G0SX63_APHGL|nr:hypothetical protein AGLY_017324 [Aphis glycines]